MDKSKIKPLIILMIIVILLGVGYAIVSSVQLDTGIKKDFENQKLDIVFKETTKVTNLDKVTAVKKEFENLTANIEVKDLKLNETVAATYTVQNKEEDVNVNLVTTKIENSNPEYFEVQTNLKENEIVKSRNGELDIEVSITLIKKPLRIEDSKTVINIEFKAIPVKKQSGRSTK
jgi:hypothetical protein